MSLAPTKLLFIGWNPPVPFGGFWSTRVDDPLRAELHVVLCALNMITSPFPDEAFLREFVDRGFYFLHAVKCWTDAKYPGFGRDKQNRVGRVEIGLPLLKICVEEHLFCEIDSLSPAAVCALGEIPYRALRFRYPKLPLSAKPTQGPAYQLGQFGLPWHLLYSCLLLPEKRKEAGGLRYRWCREFVEEHLRRFGGMPQV